MNERRVVLSTMVLASQTLMLLSLTANSVRTMQAQGSLCYPVACLAALVRKWLELHVGPVTILYGLSHPK
jgi:hypothetical protein